MKLNGVYITGMESYAKYFSFAEVWDSVPSPLEEFLTGNAAFAGVAGAAERQWRERTLEALRGYQLPQTPRKEARALLREGRVDAQALLEYAAGQGEFDAETREAVAAVCDALEGGATADTANTLLLIVLLHIGAKRPITDREAVLEAVTRRARERGDLPLPGQRGDIAWLPGYSGARNAPLLLTINEVGSLGAGDAKVVCIRGSRQLRGRPGGRHVYALMEGGEAVRFLPSLHVDGGDCYYLRGAGELAALGTGRALQATYPEPVAGFACDSELGAIGFDAAGKAFQHTRYSEDITRGRKIAQVSAYGERYALLTTRGEVLTNYRLSGEGWRDLLFVSAGMNSVVGIRKDGTVISAGTDKGVEKLSGVVFACAYNTHYACLDREGYLLTDATAGGALAEGVTAAGINARGYVFAKEEGLFLAPFGGGQTLLARPEDVVTELAASDTLVAWHTCYTVEPNTVKL